jgi:hypothetical protein
MDHPLGEHTPDLSDQQLDEKVSLLTKKYFQTRNQEARNQITLLLDMYKLELIDRSERKRADGSNKDLDNLINIE